jgi:hypothetical protein
MHSKHPHPIFHATCIGTADLSLQAVMPIQDVRKDPVVTPPPGVIRDHETAYQKTISQLIVEDDALAPICHPHG